MNIINEEALNAFGETLTEEQRSELVQIVIDFVKRKSIFLVKYYDTATISLLKEDDNTITFTCSDEAIMAL